MAAVSGGESMQELSDRVHAALASRLRATAGQPTLLCHGIALAVWSVLYWGLPARAERRLRLRNCLYFPHRYRELCGWRLGR